MKHSYGGFDLTLHFDQLKMADWYEKELKRKSKAIFVPKRLKRSRSGVLSLEDSVCRYDPKAPEPALTDEVKNIIACALHRLDHDGDRVFRAGILEGFEVVVRRIGEAVGHRAETDLAGVARLARRGHRAERAAVEAHLRRDDMVLVRAVVLDAVLARHLDHGLVGLGARALEENLVHADRRANLFRKECLRDRVRIVERLHDVSGLVLHGLSDFLKPAL